MVGRDSGDARLAVEGHTDAATLNRVVRDAVTAPALVNTDDWRGYGRLAEVGCARVLVRDTEKEWARDDDGDGVREVHTNTQEGQWTGLRNFLRPFRGVNEVYLHQYVAIFEWGHNIKRVPPRFVSALLGVPETSTDIPP